MDVLSDDVSPWGSPRQRAAQRRNKRNALLAAAARLFKEQGFASTSLEQIATQLGITKPTLYYYVRSKSELVHACAMEGWAQALDRVKRALQSASNRSLKRALEAYAHAVASDFGWCMVRVSEYMQPAALQKALTQQRQSMEQALEPLAMPKLPAAVLLRALEGVVLGLPKNQWAPAIALLGAECAPDTPAEPEPEGDLISLENQIDKSDLPTNQEVANRSVKRRIQAPKVIEQISLF